jgi:hypothetical protein
VLALSVYSGNSRLYDTISPVRRSGVRELLNRILILPRDPMSTAIEFARFFLIV